MAEQIFKEVFGNVVVSKVCTTSADLDFDKLTDPGRYDIYEECESGKTRVYCLIVDSSEGSGCVKQTRVHEGTVDTRCDSGSGWSAWENVSGNDGIRENFIAEYKVTTWEEITEAYNLGRHIYAKTGGNIYVLISLSSSNARFSRAQLKDGSGQQASIDYVNITSGNVWTSSSKAIVLKEEFDALVARVAALEGN